MNEEFKPTSSLIPVARNFKDFLERLKPYSDVEILDDYEIEDVWIDEDFLKD
jgi:hypothetical protein